MIAVWFLSSSLDGFVKNLGQDDFKYFTQELNSKILDLVKQKGFYPYEYMSGFQRFKEQFPTKKGFIVCWRVKKFVINSMSMLLRFVINLK